MSQTLLSNRMDVRRHLGRLHDFVARELPPDIAQRFDPSIESGPLGVLGLILFIRQRWNRTSPGDQVRIQNWLAGSASEGVRGILDWAFAMAASRSAESFIAPLGHWTEASRHDVFERVLAAMDPRNRRRHGFYCTPGVLAEFVVARAHKNLIDQFGQAEGILAHEVAEAVAECGDDLSAGRQLNLLDPAVGSGAFLSAIIKVARRHFQLRQQAATCRDDWSSVVTNRLLPRIFACDIQLAPLACAHVRLATSLLRSGFDFAADADLALWHLNPLATLDGSAKQLSQRATVNSSDPLDRFRRTQFFVIVGNPPYGAAQAAAIPGMRKLMHGQHSGPGGSVDYFQSAHGPIAERKTWLYDHYIQFLRFAHWRIQQSGGIIALLTNRGFLQHVTMRGLRYQWLQTFDRIEVHDFQGGDDRSNRDHGSLQENVFGIRSGIALSVLTKHSDSHGGTRQIELHVHRGDASDKLHRLADESSITQRELNVAPAAPLFLFQVAAKLEKRSLAESIPLDQCFIRKSSAIVTARDALVIGFECAEVLARIAPLRDPRVSDAALRESLFKKSRSHKYPRGDTRGWTLAEARALLSADSNWQDHIRRCSYRPLDDRYVYWHHRMVDWRRMAVSSLMIGGENLALIARRQTPDDISANYFWITRWPTIDGILRSDNRGNEYVFPLMTWDDDTPYNFSDGLLELASRKLGCEFDLASRKGIEVFASESTVHDSLTGCDLFAYLVAIAFSSSYRALRHAAMRHDFIPIAVTENEQTFRCLAQCGKNLARTIAGHGCSPDEATVGSPLDADLAITKPKWVQRQIRIGEHVVADGVDEETWAFRAGSHQVCRKWLGDRAGRRFTSDTQQQFADVLQTIRRMRAICLAIEAHVDARGGWDRILT